MPIVEVIPFPAEPDVATESPNKKSSNLMEELINFAKTTTGPSYLAVGTAAKDKTEVQLTVEWDNTTDYSALQSSNTYKLFITHLHLACGKPHTILGTVVEKSVFESGGPMESEVVEFAHNQFPISRVTPEFKLRVKTDFSKFDDIFKTEALGGTSWVADWLPKEHHHEDVKDEPTNSFLVIRGYDSMKQYEGSIQTEAFRKSLPILLAWKGHPKLVSLFFP